VSGSLLKIGQFGEVSDDIFAVKSRTVGAEPAKQRMMGALKHESLRSIYANKFGQLSVNSRTKRGKKQDTWSKNLDSQCFYTYVFIDDFGTFTGLEVLGLFLRVPYYRSEPGLQV
jgi:hypothetical protein